MKIKNKLSLIFLILINLFICTTLVEAATNGSTTNYFKILFDRLFPLFIFGSYFLAVTLAYKRFFCRGKYNNPLFHIIFLMMFLILIPYAWIYLFFIEPYLIYLGKKRGKEIISLAQLGIYIRGLNELKNLSPIINKDNNFNKNTFLEMVKKTFYTIYALRAKNDLSEVEDLISDGLYEQYSEEINSLKELKASIVVEKPEIDRIVIVGIETGKYYDDIYVAISGISKLYRKDNSNDKKYAYTEFPDWLEEIWRFSRKNGETSENDWFLSGIAPQYYFIPAGRGKKNILNTEYYNKKIIGLNEMILKDPEFCINEIEDKIYQIFWGIYYALQYLDSATLKSFCSQEFINEFDTTGKIEAFPNYKVVELKSIILRSIIIGKGDYDRIVYQVDWNGKKSITDLYNNNQKALFILRRKQNALSSSSNYYNSMHCPNCGEKIRLDSSTCSKCGEQLNNDSKYWILENIISPSTIAIQNLNDMAFNQKPSNVDSIDFSNIDFSSLDRIYGEDLIKMTIAIMLADGIIDQNEIRAITEIAAKKHIGAEQVKSMIKEIQAQSNPVEYTLNNTRISKDMTILLLLVNIAACDGKITDDEAQLLYKISDKMNIHRKLLYDMINSAYQSKAY